MRIVHVVNSLNNLAGTEVFVTKLCCEIKKNKHDVLIISLHGKPNLNLVNQLNECGVVLKILNKKNKIDFKCAREYRKIIGEFKPDIINFHEACLLNHFFAFGLKREKYKLVKTVHCSCEKDLCGGDKLLQKVFINLKGLNFICDSNEVRKSLLKHYKNKIDAFTCFPGTLNEIKKINEIHTLKNEDLSFVCVARFYKIKNHFSLLEAFKKYLNNHPNALLNLVGKGPEMENCKKFVLANNIQNSVIFHGEQTEVENFLRSCDVFILPSFYEGLGIAALEAMHVGLPLIVSNVGGLKDLVKDNINGYIFDPCDVSTIADSMERVYMNRNNLDSFIRYNYKLVKTFSIKSTFKNYFNVYQTIRIE